jgi:hypothetical protein
MSSRLKNEWKSSAAKRTLLLLETWREALEFQDRATLLVFLEPIPFLYGGIEFPAAAAIDRARQWIQGHDLELTFSAIAFGERETLLTVSAVWTDNEEYSRCSGEFTFRFRWDEQSRGETLREVELESVCRGAVLPAGSKLGRPARVRDRVLVFTVASHPHPCLRDLEESCRKHGISLEVAGKGTEYKGFTHLKVRLLYWYLESHRDEADIVLFSDGYDTLFAEGLDPILEKFRRIGGPIVFSAESNCWPGGPGREASDYPPARNRYRFLNSGGWIAELPVMLRFLRANGAARIRPGRNDQAWWTMHYLARTANIRLDHNCEIFQCLFESTQDLIIKDGRPRNIVTGSLPSILHANGCISLPPYDCYLLPATFKRRLQRVESRFAKFLQPAVAFWARHSITLRLLRVWKASRAVKSS